jgi:hypothetical protein
MKDRVEGHQHAGGPRLRRRKTVDTCRITICETQKHL